MLVTFLIGLSPIIGAQEASMDTKVTHEDYERMIENHYKIDFREKAIKSMDLTKEEIIRFDPIYNDYVSRKRGIIDERFELLRNYQDLLHKFDDNRTDSEVTADFIENFWETQIAEMELKKDFFDRFEDVVSNEKAINFLLFEEKAQSRMEEASMIGIVPMMVEVREFSRPMHKKMHKHKHKKHKEKDNSINRK